jgi:2-polyprenyl-3-methyl-5-hydroxy-6-metoxy-1,4-benzoquinol methylase
MPHLALPTSFLPPHPLVLAAHLPPRALAPLATPLDRARQAEVPTVLHEFAFVAKATGMLLDELAAQAPDSPRATALAAAIDAQALGLLGELRQRPLQPVRHPLLTAAARIDAALHSERPEIMDLGILPARLQRWEMQALDRVNRNLGSYARWGKAVQSVLAATDRPHVVDLAAGSGGFLRRLAQTGKAEGWRLTATDLSATYVDEGRLAAAKERVDVGFEVRDCTRLDGLAPPVDLFVCTQSLHHLPAGVVLRMIHGAVRHARCGLLAVDVVRSVVNVLGAALATATTVPYAPLILDGMQSVRRGWSGAELLLLAKVAGAAEAMVDSLGPAHVVLHARGVAVG